jgi:hypothetical protein
VTIVTTDWSIPANRARITAIQCSVVEYALWEAYLEAAPQFIFQVSILTQVELSK